MFPLRKRQTETLIICLCVVLVGVGAFGLGRLSVFMEQKRGVVIHPPYGTTEDIGEPIP